MRVQAVRPTGLPSLQPTETIPARLGDQGRFAARRAPRHHRGHQADQIVAPANGRGTAALPLRARFETQGPWKQHR